MVIVLVVVVIITHSWGSIERFECEVDVTVNSICVTAATVSFKAPPSSFDSIQVEIE